MRVKSSKVKSFEQKMADLESIISDLKEDKVSLADTIKKYEKGMQLVSQCQAEINDFEHKITVLSEKSNAATQKLAK